jgi:ribonuclease BN (tRNA processing enzyme)
VLAVDAGPLGHALSVEDQSAITDVLLTHAHIDHIAGLPVFLDNVYQAGTKCPTIHAQPDTLHTLQTDLFNGRLMPDFIGMSRTLPPFLHLLEVGLGQFRVGRYSIVALPLDHTVPTVGYLIDDGSTAVAILTDTASVPEVIAPLARWPRLRAVFLECSFPRRMAHLAAITKHLTTEQFCEAMSRFPPEVGVYAVHIKPRYWYEVLTELQNEESATVRIGEPGSVVLVEP